MSTTITGLFEEPSDASAAMHTLIARGVSESAISVVASDAVATESFAIDRHSKLPEGVAIGAGSGGAVGALVAGLTSVGAIATGGTGLLVAGPMIAAFAGAGAGAAGGAVVGGAIGAAVPEHEVRHYEDALEQGAVLVGVECEDDDVERLVKDTFEHFDAEKVSTA